MEVKIESATPIHIGNGNSYRAIFLKQNKRVSETEVLSKLINEELVKKALRDEELFTWNRIKEVVERENFSTLYYVAEIDRRIRNEEIYETIKHKNKPYIPGSTIKGMLVTAFIYDKLMNKGSKEILEIAKLLRGKNLASNIRLLEKKFGLKISVSDCILDEYKLKVGFVKVGMRKTIVVEVIDEFKGKFLLETNVQNILEIASKFCADYLKRLENLRELEPNSRELIRKLKEENRLLVLGRFTNLFSKSIQLLFEKKNIKIKNIKKPSFIRIFEINGKKNLLGLVKWNENSY